MSGKLVIENGFDSAGSATITGSLDITEVVVPRVAITTSTGTPTPNVDTTDLYALTALATGATFGAPTGTPVHGQKLIIRVLDNGTSRSLAYNAAYRAFGATLPTATTAGKTLYLGCIYNSTAAVWDVIAVTEEV